jgi:hypothetical protein
MAALFLSAAPLLSDRLKPTHRANLLTKYVLAVGRPPRNYGRNS